MGSAGVTRPTERKPVKHCVLLTAGIVAALLVWLEGIAGGYFAGATPVALWFFYPFFFLAIVAIPILIATGYCGMLVFRKKTRRNILQTLVSLLGPVVLGAGPTLFSGYDAFVFRMKDFSEDEYHSLAEDVLTELRGRGLDRLHGYDIHETEQDAIYRSLVGRHPVLAFADDPPAILASADSVSLYWGVGFDGGYEAVTLLSSEPPYWPNPSGLPSTYIYDSVVVRLAP